MTSCIIWIVWRGGVVVTASNLQPQVRSPAAPLHIHDTTMGKLFTHPVASVHKAV